MALLCSGAGTVDRIVGPARGVRDDGVVPRNFDSDVVAGFGDEWSRFSQDRRTESELRQTFERYFSIFPWELVATSSVGFDLGCGSGRWARFVSQRCGRLVCIDASEEALQVAQRLLAEQSNTEFHCASAGDLPFADDTFDFGYSLGVLHHTPEPLVGLRDAVRVLRPGAPLLVYLYYALDNRPAWFRFTWRLTDVVRRGVSRAPHPIRYALSQVLAVTVYWPLARFARVVARLGGPADRIPLAGYSDKPFYVMRTDALDRFGTRIEHRFTREGVIEAMSAAGLVDVRVSDTAPYWCAVGVKA